MNNFLDAFLEKFRDPWDTWYYLTRRFQDFPLQFWGNLRDVPIIGSIVKFFEFIFGARPVY